MKTLNGLYWKDPKYKSTPFLVNNCMVKRKYSWKVFDRFPQDYPDPEAEVEWEVMFPIPIRLLDLKTNFPHYLDKDHHGEFYFGQFWKKELSRRGPENLVKELKKRRGDNYQNWEWNWYYPLISFNLSFYKFYKIDFYVGDILGELLWQNGDNNKLNLKCFFKRRAEVANLVFKKNYPCPFLNPQRDRILSMFPEILKQACYHYFTSPNKAAAFSISYYAGLTPLAEDEIDKPLKLIRDEKEKNRSIWWKF